MNIKEAIEILCKELKSDKDYRYTWQANIAMSFKDEWQRTVNNAGLSCNSEHIHEIANKAADHFLTILCLDKVEMEADDGVVMELYNPKNDMTASERAENLAEYFGWDIPSEQHSCVLDFIQKAIIQEREACAMVAQQLDTMCACRHCQDVTANVIRERGVGGAG